jgi:hypothetical protein
MNKIKLFERKIKKIDEQIKKLRKERFDLDVKVGLLYRLMEKET